MILLSKANVVSRTLLISWLGMPTFALLVVSQGKNIFLATKIAGNNKLLKYEKYFIFIPFFLRTLLSLLKV